MSLIRLSSESNVMMPRQPLTKLGIGLAAELLCICLMAGHGNFLQAGEATRFTVLAILAGLAFWLAVRSFLRVKLSPRTSARWLWIAALVLRVAMLPILPGDDVWRCRWEGAIQLRGFNPYQLAPDAPVLAGLRDADWSRINHQNVPAIYPPLAELMFAALARGGVPVWGYKLLFALADLGVVALLRRLLVRRGSSPDAAAWYAWNPLAIYVSAGGAHFDSLMVLAMMGAVCCLDWLPASPAPEPGVAWRTPTMAWISTLLLGIAIAVKAVPAALLPVWFFALGWRRALVTLPVALSLSPLLALLYGFPGVPVFATLGHFARDFRVNDAMWWLVDSAGRAGEIYGVVAALICLTLAVWFRRDWRRGVLWVLGAALLLSPVLHAWYVLWLLPLAVWRGASAQAWLVLSVSEFGYFLLWEVNHDSGLPWMEPLWLRLLIYLPPLLTFAWLVLGHRSAPADPAETCYR